MRAFLRGRIPRPDREEANAILVDGDRIAFVGSDEEARLRLGRSGETVDLDGALVLPGFQDAHMHLCQTGRFRVRPDLGGAPTLASALARAERYREEKREGTLFLGGFDESTWPERRRPTREELDQVEEVRPLIFRRVCGHIAVANRAALERIPPSTPKVDRSTGLLEEEAVFDLETDFFPPTRDENRKAILRMQEEAFSLGVTGVHEIDVPAVADAYRSLEEEGSLRLRIAFFAYASPEETADLRRSGERGLFRVAGVKAFLDGSLGGGTAALHLPYEGEGGTGVLLMEPDEIERFLRSAESLRLPAACHAIGERAIDELLDAHERMRADSPPAALPHRIEHAEMLSDEAAERVRALGLLLSMQPNFAARWGGDGGMYGEKLGPERARRLSRTGSWARRSIPLAFGSDGMPFDPFYGLAGAVEHPVPEERLTPAEATALYTAAAERFVTGGGDAGSLEAGKRADFLLFSSGSGRDRLPRREDLLLTVAGGEIVYER